MLKATALICEPVESIKTLSLRDDEVHLWWADLDISVDLADDLAQHLTDKQRSKISSVTYQDDVRRSRYIASRVYLKKLISAYLGRDDFELEYNVHGKPSLVNDGTNLFFNYSDTLGKGVFCFTRNSEVGIDIEALNRSGNFQRIAKRRFSENEQAYLSQFSGEQFSKQFLIGWTRKEAYGKAVGVGLNYTKSQYDFCVAPQGQEFLYSGAAPDKATNKAKEWVFQQLQYTADETEFAICLVTEGSSPKTIKAMQFVGQDVLNSS